MGKLFIVATPIGNLKDITLRALEVLKSVDLIACEDTRVTVKLLNHYEIKKPLVSFHEHTKIKKIENLISELQIGKNIALVTDAGTPGIADPGGVLVSEAIKNDIEVVPIPGVSALTTALSIAGFPSNEFIFLGYFPKKKGRQTLLKGIAQEKRTIVFYESPHRILKTLDGLKEYLENREIVVCRELTKKFEEIYRGKVSDIIGKVKPKGEFVIVIKGKK